jgi:hypothetical protein
MLWLLCGLGRSAAYAYVCTPGEMSTSWGYQPVYNSGRSLPACEFRPTSTYINSKVYVCSADASKANRMPLCEFRTTSIYVGELAEAECYHPLFGHCGPRKASAFEDVDEDEDSPVGVAYEPVVPMGDTPWLLLLLLAAGYIGLFARKRFRNE